MPKLSHLQSPSAYITFKSNECQCNNQEIDDIVDPVHVATDLSSGYEAQYWV